MSICCHCRSRFCGVGVRASPARHGATVLVVPVDTAVVVPMVFPVVMVIVLLVVFVVIAVVDVCTS